MITPHQAIILVTGNSFGSGDELARDILCSLENCGYSLVRTAEVHGVRDYLAEDTQVCHRVRYGMECLLPAGHPGIHRAERDQ